MVDDRESPSAGWREVYHEMDADPSAEEPTHSCPDCGRTCRNLLRDVYECDEHGVFRASARGSDESATADSERRETGDGNRETTDRESRESTDCENRDRTDRSDSGEEPCRTTRDDSPNADEPDRARWSAGSD